ncbi:MAG TPA: ADOP family duplicated permease [Gemmatimonadaceae bacterium]|nr:ADOP family duplicated permease [Gemmatimonadaceae bacterium]
MRFLRMAAVRLRAAVRRRHADAELDEELRYHLERDIERRVAAGETPTGARAAATRAFGNVTVLAEQAREASRIEAVEQLAQDARYALRGVRRAPRFAVTVVLTIGLGLGLVTTAFTIFDAYVLRLLAVRDPRTLYALELRRSWGAARNVRWTEYDALRRANPALTDALATLWIVVRRDGEPLMLQAVSGNFFTMLGVPPSLGRVLDERDAASRGAGAVIVLSHRAWQTKFGGDSAVVGKPLRLRGRTFEVVGVAREGFDGLTDTPPDFWVPLTMAGALHDAGDVFAPADPPILKVVGRLAPGMTAAGASVALGAWARNVTRDRPEQERVSSVVLEPRATATYMSPQTMAEVSPIFLAFVLVLMIACANVANMMLARGMARQREVGIRLALGAGRGRIVRQLMTEAVLLALPAGIVGFAVSRVAIEAGIRLMFATVPRTFVAYLKVLSLAPDGRLFTFLLLAAVVASFAFGLIPALQTTRTHVVNATRGEFSAGGRPHRWRNALVIGQVVVCTVLLVSGGVLLRGAQRLQTLDVGFRSNGVLDVYAPGALHDRVVERLRAHPGVDAIEAASQAPLDGRFRQWAVSSSAASSVTAGGNRVTPGYFTALGIAVVRGRTFSLEEARSREAVVVVSEAAARQLWPSGDAIGATVLIASGDAGQPSLARTARVVGVVRDVVAGIMIERRDHPTIYEPTALEKEAGPLIVTMRSGSGEAARESVRASLAAVDPGGSVEIHTLDDSVELQLYPFQAAHWIASAIGVIALLLTISGIYGVLSYVVAMREKEIGIRVALGATRGMIAGLVVRQSVRLALTGVVVGAVLALGTARFIGSRLSIIPAFDAVAAVAGSMVVLAAAMLAAYVPSRRAAAVDPAEILRG